MFAMAYEIPSLVLARFFFAGWRPRRRPWWHLRRRRFAGTSLFVPSARFRHRGARTGSLWRRLIALMGGDTDGAVCLVSRTRPDLYEYLVASKIFEAVGVKLMLDRRHGEQRQRVEPVEVERRRADRRTAWAPSASGNWIHVG